jgi:hypothetical protein
MATNSLSLLVPTANVAVAGSLTPRYQYVSVINETGCEIFVRTDGNAATVDGDFCTMVGIGERALIANMTPLWTQAQTVIQNGSVNQWAQGKNGGAANPGTPVSVIIPSTATPQTTPPSVVTIQGAG